MIRKAGYKDIDAILRIVNEVIKLMQRAGNDQWNESYPVYKDFYDDISLGELFVDSIDEGDIRSFICLNQTQPPEYAAVEWGLDKEALVIHRMAVNPVYQGIGLANQLMSFAEEKAVDSGLDYIRSDTCSINTGMNSLFNKFDYLFTGILHFQSKRQDFNCYEKILTH